jgi:hypothetical protein
MKITPSDRIAIISALARTDMLWAEQTDRRARFIAAVTMVEALVENIAKEHGRRHAWEWLQRMSDQLLGEDQP